VCSRCSCSIPQVVRGYRHWRIVMECHHTSTVRWQVSWIGICLANTWAKGGSLPDLRHRHIWPLRRHPVRLCEKRCVRSATAYNREQLEGSNTNCDCKNWTDFI
jgi:hypothetical protein